MMDQTALLQAAWDAADELKASEPYLAMRSAWNRIESDPTTKRLRDDFEAAKAKMDAIRPYGKYHPDFKTASDALVKAKAKYQETDAYQAYIAAKSILDDMLREFSRRMNALVDPVLFESQSSCPTR
jgi:cell fate (sporulation/competence/biofilm development) regulator YlbF (YheA/YmcA/DUF963 family)